MRLWSRDFATVGAHSTPSERDTQPMTTPVPEPLRELVSRWRSTGSPTQPGIPWPRDRWIKDFPAHGDILGTMPELLDRAAVRTACDGAADDAHAAEGAFIAVCTWGFGNRGYGRHRAQGVLDDPRGAGGRLLAIARTLAESGPLPAYRRFGPRADSELRGLGTSFGTKYLYFCQPPGHAVTALILDDLVSKWFGRETGYAFNSQPWAATTYGEYLDRMHEWAAELECRPDELECCIFQKMATERGGQWGTSPPNGADRAFVQELPTSPLPLTPGRWAVGLVEGDWELAEIAPHFTGTIRVERRDDGWELTAGRFQEAGEATAIRTLAGEMLALINGVARLRLDRPEPVSLGNVRRYREDGTKDAWVFPEPIRARVRMGTPTILVNGVAVSPRSWEPDLELAARDARVQGVLAFLATGPTWHSLYAALDTVIRDPRTGRRDGVLQWGGVTDADLRLFKETANSFSAVGVHARHGPGTPTRRTAMNLGSGEELVGRIVERWLDELRRRGG